MLQFCVVQEKVKEWQHRLGSSLGLHVEELTGDSDSMQDIGRTEDADIICTTPEKFGNFTLCYKDPCNKFLCMKPYVCARHLVLNEHQD